MYTAREIFQVHLVNNANAWGHYLECIEGLHAPLHKLITLFIALKLKLHIQIERFFVAKVIDHDRVIHYQIHGHKRLNELWVFAHGVGHIAHGR